MMEAMERWQEEKDLGREGRGPEATWNLPALLVQVSPTPPITNVEKLRQHAGWIWGSSRSSAKTRLNTDSRVCDLRQVN